MAPAPQHHHELEQLNHSATTTPSAPSSCNEEDASGSAAALRLQKNHCLFCLFGLVNLALFLLFEQLGFLGDLVASSGAFSYALAALGVVASVLCLSDLHRFYDMAEASSERKLVVILPLCAVVLGCVGLIYPFAGTIFLSNVAADIFAVSANLVVVTFAVSLWLYGLLYFRHLAESAGGALENGATLQVGDVVALTAGQFVYADGTMTEGVCQVLEKRYGGAQTPAVLYPGCEVLAGSIVVRGGGKYEVELEGEDSRISYFLDAFQKTLPEAIAGQSPMLLAIVASVIFIGISSAIFWSENGVGIIESALVFLAVLSIFPLISLSGLQRSLKRCLLAGGFKRGVLFKDFGALQKLGDVESLVFDAGEGQYYQQLSLAEFAMLDDRVDETGLKQILVSVLGSVDEDYARTISSVLYEELEEKRIHPIDSLSHYSGRGVAASVQGVELSVGYEEFVLERGVELQHSEAAPEEEGQRHIYVAFGREAVARVDFEESFALQPEVFTRLRQAGVRVQLMSSSIPSELLDPLGKRAGFELADISGGLDAVEYQRRVAGSSRVALVGTSETDEELLRVAHTDLLMFNEVHYELFQADATLFDRTPSDVADIVLYAREVVALRLRATQLTYGLCAILLSAAVAGYFPAAVVAICALVGWSFPLITASILLPQSKAE